MEELSWGVDDPLGILLYLRELMSKGSKGRMMVLWIFCLREVRGKDSRGRVTVL
jgi:hypothetical protein